MSDIPVLSGQYAPAGSGGQYGWNVDPAAYAAGFTDLNAPWNQMMSGMVPAGQSMLQNWLGQMPTMLNTSGLDQFIGSQTGGRQAWDQSLLGGFVGGGMGVSDSIMRQFMSQMPQIQGLVSGMTSPYETGLRDSLRRMTGEVTSEVGSQLSGMGALYSGATEDFIGKRMGAATQDSFTNLAQLQAGLTGQLGQGALSAITSGAGMGLQGLTTGLGSALDIARTNLSAGQNAAGMGINAGLGMMNAGIQGYRPEFVAPDLTFQPTWWQSQGAGLLSGLGTLAGGALGALGGPMGMSLGASLGGGLGGMIGGAFGGGGTPTSLPYLSGLPGVWGGPSSPVTSTWNPTGVPGGPGAYGY